MTETYYHCKCGFVCVEGQLAKTDGACPRCGAIRADMAAKHSFSPPTKKVM